jgi:hypothetical protein
MWTIRGHIAYCGAIHNALKADVDRSTIRLCWWNELGTGRLGAVVANGLDTVDISGVAASRI